MILTVMYNKCFIKKILCDLILQRNCCCNWQLGHAFDQHENSKPKSEKFYCCYVKSHIIKKHFKALRLIRILITFPVCRKYRFSNRIRKEN